MRIVKKSIEFDIKIRDFKFYGDTFEKGSFRPTPIPAKIRFTHYINILGFGLINKTERKIKFHFKLEMNPDIGLINFEGECILESPQQHRIDFVIKNIPKPLRKFIDTFILKYSYYHAEEIAKLERIPFPPATFLLQGLGIKLMI